MNCQTKCDFCSRELNEEDGNYYCNDCLYGDNETLKGQLLLRNRFNEIAKDFIRDQFEKGSLARVFEKESVDFHLSPERYIKCTLSKKKLESRRL